MVCDTEGLVIARFEHRTSRAGDPQLHSHCLVLNKVRDPRRWVVAGAGWPGAVSRGQGGGGDLSGRAARRADPTPRGARGDRCPGMGRPSWPACVPRSWRCSANAPPRSRPPPTPRSPSSKTALGRPLEAAERAGIGRLAVLDTRAPKTGRGLDDRTLHGAWRARAARHGHEPAALVRRALTRRARRGGAGAGPRGAGPGRAGRGDGRAGDVRRVRDVAQAVARHLELRGDPGRAGCDPVSKRSPTRWSPGPR